MSDRESLRKAEPEDNLDSAPRATNLVAIYAWMLVALLVAIGLAMLIVLPFYRRR